MFGCSTIGDIASLMFIIAMGAFIYVVYKINMTLTAFRNFMGGFKYLTSNGLRFGFFNILANILGVRKVVK